MTTLSEGLPILLRGTWQNPRMFGGRAWFEFEQMRVYVRVGPRSVRPGAVFIQIADIEMPTDLQRTGIFTRMVREIRKLTVWPLYLENCRTDFAKSLVARHGWKIVSDPSMSIRQVDLILQAS
jgi:hypothetical protein